MAFDYKGTNFLIGTSKECRLWLLDRDGLARWRCRAVYAFWFALAEISSGRAPRGIRQLPCALRAAVVSRPPRTHPPRWPGRSTGRSAAIDAGPRP
jgi:hypothetical protein